jgi:hypothetical protein
MPIKDLVMQNVKVNGEEFKAPTTAPTTRP